MDEGEEDSNFDQFGATTQAAGESNSQTRGTNSTPTISKQTKRKSNELDSLEVEFSQITKSISGLIDFEKENSLPINDIKKAFTYQADAHEQSCDKRKQLFQVLCKLPGLNAEEVVKATRLIGQDIAKMDLFYTMPDDYKVIFARQEIDGTMQQLMTSTFLASGLYYNMASIFCLQTGCLVKQYLFCALGLYSSYM